MDADQVEGKELDTRLIRAVQDKCHGCYGEPEPCQICQAAARLTALSTENAELREADRLLRELVRIRRLFGGEYDHAWAAAFAYTDGGKP